MPETQELKNEVHALGRVIAGIQPLVQEVHGQMPSIAEALKTLATVTAKLENNTEDHKRLHYRLTEVVVDVKELKEQFGTLKEEHTICITTKQIERRVERTSWWAKAKNKAGEKVVEIVTLAVVGYAAWMIISHLPEYPKTAPVINQAIRRGVDK